MDNLIEVPNGTTPPNDPPITMQDLLDRAHNDWKLHRKDACIMKLLSAMAMMSAGVAEAMKTSGQALQVAQLALESTEKKEE